MMLCKIYDVMQLDKSKIGERMFLNFDKSTAVVPLQTVYVWTRSKRIEFYSLII